MRRSFLVLLALLLLAPASACLPARQALAAPSDAPSKKVEIFVTSWCPYCRKLESFLKSNHIDYTRYDVEQDPKGAGLFEKLGGDGVPVIRVGDQVIRGYDPDAVLEALHA